jgi:lipoprotein NlpD
MTLQRLAAMMAVLILGSCAASSGVYHTVREGETLYRIGRTYGVDERELARANDIDEPTRLRAGDRLFIPGADRLRVVPPASVSRPAQPTGSPPAREPKKAPASGTKALPLKSTSLRPAEPGKASGTKAAPSAQPSPSPSAGAAPPQEKGKLVWPLKGEILRSFGSGATPSKGLEIAAPQGSPVLSAAAGRVIYSGDGIRSYGNLIIVRHDDSLFTVYGYNERNMVKPGTFVSKGERIALSGSPPDGGRPRLYFEIRYGKQAVDPFFYLP